VDAGHRGLIFDRFGGIKPKVYGEGTHMMIPGLQRPIIIDVRTSPRSISTQTGTKDLQNVNLSLRVLSHPSLPHLPEIYKKLGTDYAERVLPGICNEVLKAVVAQVRPQHDGDNNEEGSKQRRLCGCRDWARVCIGNGELPRESHSAHFFRVSSFCAHCLFFSSVLFLSC